MAKWYLIFAISISYFNIMIYYTIYLKYKVNAERKSKVDDNTAKMQSIKWLGV